MPFNQLRRLPLASAIFLPVPAFAADVTVQIKLAAADALEVSYDLPASCNRLAFLETGASYREFRASWRTEGDCGKLDDEGLGASCRTHLGNSGASPLSVIGNSLGGAIDGMAFILARSLWLPIGLHFAWNFTQGPLLGFPVSGMDAGGLQRIVDAGPAWLTGGAYGPEAGAVGILCRFAVIALLLAWTNSSRGRAGNSLPALATAGVPARPRA